MLCCEGVRNCQWIDGVQYHHGDTYMVEGFICSHVGIDCNHQRFVLGVVDKRDYICIRSSCCLAYGVPARGIGCVGDPSKREICKFGLYCCEAGFIKPGCSSEEPCISEAQKVCCLYGVSSLPLAKGYVEKPVCAYHGLQCFPGCGCCGTPPRAVVLDRLTNFGNINETMDAYEMPSQKIDRGDEESLEALNVTGGDYCNLEKTIDKSIV